VCLIIIIYISAKSEGSIASFSKTAQENLTKATMPERMALEKTAPVRTALERTAPERTALERTALEKMASERTVSERMIKATASEKTARATASERKARATVNEKATRQGNVWERRGGINKVSYYTFKINNKKFCFCSVQKK